MPELHIQDLPELAELEGGDFFNVQRHDGTWLNYRTTNATILGLPTLSYEFDYTFAELDPGNPPVEMLPDPGAGNVYLIVNAWVRYNQEAFDVHAPQVIKVTGHWFEQNQSFSAMLRTIPQGHAAAMYWEGQSNAGESYVTDRNFRLQCATTPGGAIPDGTGTITVHLEVAVVAL